MNTYKIIFTRENGTQGTDHFTAINERQARKDFGECYSHSTATIISIELASTNTPATKQQERDTLEKIRKMVEQLGPDSYLAAAFEGCFDLAAENIDNDWACSMADRARNAEKRVADLEDKLSEAVKDYEADCGYDVILGNPPYSLALDFINKSLELLHPGGLLIFLLRTNFLESEKRFKWWQEHPLSGLYTLHKRPSFTGRGTDATSYSWFVWERGGPAA